MDVLDAQTVADTFPPDGASGPVALLGPIFGSNGGYYNVQANPVYAQYAYGVYGAYYWSEPVPIPVGPAILQPGTVGVRFKNYVAGQVAVVSGALSEPNEPSVQITSGGLSADAGTLKFQHNGVLIAAESTLDLEDAGANIWVPTDDPSNNRLQLSLRPKRTIQSFAAGPPAAPSDGDEWIVPNVDGVGLRWVFQWNNAAGWWEFAGGPPWVKADASGAVINTLPTQPVATWYTDNNTIFTIPRPGSYHVRGWADIGRNGGGNGAIQGNVYKNAALNWGNANGKIENTFNNNETISIAQPVTVYAQGDTTGFVLSGAGIATWVQAWKVVELVPQRIT